MTWIVGAICLAIGVVAGVVFAGRVSTGTARVKELEIQIRSLRESNERYREDVSEHFNSTAELIQQMTESYRDVYQHLAHGAQELCSGEVASKLLPTGSDTVFEKKDDSRIGVYPPKDYATRDNPEQKGALSEDFGLARNKAYEKEKSEG